MTRVISEKLDRIIVNFKEFLEKTDVQALALGLETLKAQSTRFCEVLKRKEPCLEHFLKGKELVQSYYTGLFCEVSSCLENENFLSDSTNFYKIIGNIEMTEKVRTSDELTVFLDTCELEMFASKIREDSKLLSNFFERLSVKIITSERLSANFI